MPTAATEVQPTELDEKANPHSFQNIFARVIVCTRAHKISEKEIFRLIPMQVSNWYSHSQFSRGYQDALEGSPPEGIMAANVATAILAAIKAFDESIPPPEKPTRKPREVKGDAKAPAPAPVDPMAELTTLFGNLVAVKVPEPEPEPEPVPEGMFDFEQVRERIAVILDSVGMPLQDIYAQLPAQNQTPENAGQIIGWFDGSVRYSPKTLVEQFFCATIAALENRPHERAINDLSGCQRGVPLMQWHRE